MDVVPREKHTYPCATPPGQLEHDGQQGVEVLTGQIRLEAGWEHLQKNQRDLQPHGGGLVCIQTNTPVLSLFQLTALSLHGGDRCIPSRLVITEGVCQPHLEPSIQWPGKDTDTGSQHCFGCSSVEDVILVYPHLLAMLADFLRLLPHQVGMIAHLEPHLAIWSISGKNSETSNFQCKLRSLSSSHGG